MKRQFGVVAAAVGALVLLSQAAHAGPWPRVHKDPRVATAGVVVGLASTATFLSLNDWSYRGDWNTVRAGGLTTGGAVAATTIGCAALSPMLATAIVQRPLTMREGHTLIAGCVIPFIGPLIVSAAYDAHPEWEGGAVAPGPRRVYRHRAHRR
jgi:hypothetical protein